MIKQSFYRNMQNSTYRFMSARVIEWHNMWCTVPQVLRSPLNMWHAIRTTSASILRMSGNTSGCSGLAHANSLYTCNHEQLTILNDISVCIPNLPHIRTDLPHQIIISYTLYRFMGAKRPYHFLYGFVWDGKIVVKYYFLVFIPQSIKSKQERFPAKLRGSRLIWVYIVTLYIYYIFIYDLK